MPIENEKKENENKNATLKLILPHYELTSGRFANSPKNKNEQDQ